MTDLTDPRPRFLDRVRAAIDAFRHPQRAYVAGLLAGIRAYPHIRTGA